MTIKFPRAAVLFLGVFMAVALVGCVELALRVLVPSEVEGLQVELVKSYEGAAGQDNPTWVNRPLSGYSVRYWFEGKFVAYSEVNFDTIGRRVVPHPDSKPRKKHLIFMGGSLAFGDGVSDHETLAAAYAKQDPQSRVYNYGIPGGGPNQFAFQLENERFFSPEAVPERDGTLVYVFYDRYLTRVQNSASLFTYWQDRPMPSYRLNKEGKAEYEGEFREVHPWRTFIYTMLAKSAIIRLLRLDYPFFPDRYAYEMSAAMIQYTKEKYLRQFPNGRFVVVLYPEKTRRAEAKLLHKLKARGIEALNYYSDLYRFPTNNSKYWIQHHEHPTGQMNTEFSSLLFKDINQIPRPR